MGNKKIYDYISKFCLSLFKDMIKIKAYAGFGIKIIYYCYVIFSLAYLYTFNGKIFYLIVYLSK